MKAILALIASASAIQINWDRYQATPIHHPKLHWNEDPNSVPVPLKGVPFLTSTQARFINQNSTENQWSTEPRSTQWWFYKYSPYNVNDGEYSKNSFDREYVETSNFEFPEETVLTMAESGEMWRVMPDYGELDNNVVGREKDVTLHGNKFSGWSNPLSWRDSGADDDKVL